jgi:adenosylcobyric acid synthase
MSNNAAVTSEGLEIGRAQYLQALAARVPAQARMNPLLLKPSADTHSQVIVMGRYDPVITATPWLERKPLLWPIVSGALHSLLDDYDQVVIEGAGSPAEINLRDAELVNMQIALECHAAVYLAVDIDRGGAFAHLLGTFLCLSPEERALIQGFVLNKFRGDQALLGNAMDWLQERTGVPTVAIVPYLRHHLPEEDTLHHRSRHDAQQINIALLAYPYASNLDEFDALVHEPGVNVVPIRELTALDDYRVVLLPGSKNTAASLRYLRETGLAAEVVRAAQRGTAVFGVCGGLQLLGRSIADPLQLEDGDVTGLGLLDLETTLHADKTTAQREVACVEGGTLRGYEIHHGRTQAGAAAREHLADGLGWQQGNVWGVYLHGAFDSTHYRQRFLQRLGWQGQSVDWSARLETELDRIAALVEQAGLRV